MNNNMFNLNHKSDYYLMNNYENNFDNNEYGYNKKYSFTPKKGFTFKQDKYK